MKTWLATCSEVKRENPFLIKLSMYPRLPSSSSTSHPSQSSHLAPQIPSTVPHVSSQTQLADTSAVTSTWSYLIEEIFDYVGDIVDAKGLHGFQPRTHNMTRNSSFATITVTTPEEITKTNTVVILASILALILALVWWARRTDGLLIDDSECYPALKVSLRKVGESSSLARMRRR